MPLFQRFRSKQSEDDESSEEEAVDLPPSLDHLSHVGMAAYTVLRKHHHHHYKELWNVSKGKVVGKLHLTPHDAFTRNAATHHDPPDHHDDWFPEALGEMIARTEEWCDVLSLSPPDGLFLSSFQKALTKLCSAQEERALLGRVTIRMMFGNILGSPMDCTKVLAELTNHLPKDGNHKIKLWVGSWRKGISWNHSKIIAIDGKYLWTGGHNFYDRHYLQNNPIVDLSLELEGTVALDAHYYANAQWGYIVKKQSTGWGKFVDQNIPDGWEVPRRARVTVSEFPTQTTAEFAPHYKQKRTPLLRGPRRMLLRQEDPEDQVPIITMGRYGCLLKQSRPSDDAFVAMISSAQQVIRMSLQDLGPMKIPGTNRALPGLQWPTAYLNALARVTWEKGVDVEIVLSNPESVPGGLNPGQSSYGNGWTCVEVAAEIIKAIQQLFPHVPDAELRNTVQDHLRICYMRCPKGGTTYQDNKTIGLHSKHFIIDDICCYIGSQNLYICDLAEWGVVIDDAKRVQAIKEEYWDPMWKIGYRREDCNVSEVMDGLQIDRSPLHKSELTTKQSHKAQEQRRLSRQAPSDSKFHCPTPMESDGDSSDSSEAED